MNLTNAALQLGKSKAFFYVMRKQNPKAFEWYLSFHKEVTKSYSMAVELAINTREQLQSIIWELEDSKDDSVYGFSKYLYEMGVFSNRNSFSSMINQKFRENVENFYLIYHSDIKIVEAYKKYKGNEDD